MIYGVAYWIRDLGDERAASRRQPARPRPTCSSGRPPASVRPASRWSRRRSSPRASGSSSRSAAATHGVQKTLIADDLAYWKSQRDWLKPGDRPLALQSRTEHGCPYDCGLCPDHEQHSCLAIIEINDACNLTCPVCFAESRPSAAAATGRWPRSRRCWTRWSPPRASPTWCRSPAASRPSTRSSSRSWRRRRRRPIRHLMINTNGLAHRPRARLRRAAGRVHAAASRSTCSSTRCGARR